MTPAEFSEKWHQVQLSDRAAAQQHFLDLCALVKHKPPAEFDPTGETFTFERGVAKQDGGGGWADVWKRGFFGWEYKGKNKDLDAAYRQLLQYREALENPPLLAVCDLDRIIVHTNFTAVANEVHEIRLQNLDSPRNLEILDAIFHEPEKLHPGRTSEAVTKEAAGVFAEIAASLRARGIPPDASAHFLDRVVFCLFAEDIGLLPEELFTRVLRACIKRPADFPEMAGQLFRAMAKGGSFGPDLVRHFNGSLFEDASALELTGDELRKIMTITYLDWSAVDVSIFGTLFERSMDPAKRAQRGAHYTGRQDIELLIDPVVIQPLRNEWVVVRHAVETLLATGKKDAGARVSRPPRGWHSRGYLPHCDISGLVQSVTFRLADSLPEEKLAQWRLELGLLAGVRASRPQDLDPNAVTPELPATMLEFHRRMEEWLNRGHGECHLRDPRIAQLVEDALLHFDGERYRMLAWSIMPNHVHVVFATVPGHRLEDILHSWKSFTAKAANKLLRREGQFWQEEYFDRFIRNQQHLCDVLRYIDQNPVEAKLVADSGDWRYGSAWNGRIQEDAGETPALPPLRPLLTPALPPLRPLLLRKAKGEADVFIHEFLVRLQGVKDAS